MIPPDIYCSYTLQKRPERLVLRLPSSKITWIYPKVLIVIDAESAGSNLERVSKTTRNEVPVMWWSWTDGNQWSRTTSIGILSLFANRSSPSISNTLFSQVDKIYQTIKLSSTQKQFILALTRYVEQISLSICATALYEWRCKKAHSQAKMRTCDPIIYLY